MKTKAATMLLCLASLLVLLTGCHTKNVYYIKLEDTYGLSEGDPVLIKGKEVGRVSAVNLKDSNIIATIELDKKYHIYKNAVVTVIDVNLLGGKAIEIKYARANSQVLNNKEIITGTYNDAHSISSLIHKADTLIQPAADSIIISTP